MNNNDLGPGAVLDVKCTDGNIRKLKQKNIDFQKTLAKDVMTKNPITITSDSLAIKALRIMNEKKITSLCVINGKNFEIKDNTQLKTRKPLNKDLFEKLRKKHKV